MGAHPYPQQDPRPQTATYWRRRFLALVAGLILLAVIAWAFSGALGGANAAGTLAGGPGHPGSGPGPASAGSPSAAAGGSTGTATGSPAPDAGSAGRSPAPAASAAGSSGGPGYCAAQAVVLSLSAGQATAGPGQAPQFDVDVVSTAAQACKFNVGTGHLILVIRSGKAKIWSSADCAQGAGSLVTELQRGIPTVLPVSWNLQLSAPGCGGRSSRVPAGTYTATATDGALSSSSQTFRVR